MIQLPVSGSNTFAANCRQIALSGTDPQGEGEIGEGAIVIESRALGSLVRQGGRDLNTRLCRTKAPAGSLRYGLCGAIANKSRSFFGMSELILGS